MNIKLEAFQFSLHQINELEVPNGEKTGKDYFLVNKYNFYFRNKNDITCTYYIQL